MPYFKLKKPPYFVRFHPCLVLDTDSPFYFRKNTSFPCSILNKDQHGQNTEFFYLKIRQSVYRLKPLRKKL